MIVNNIVWANFSVIMFQSVNDKVTEITYDLETENKEFYGVQQNPIGLIRGKQKYKGTISMYIENWQIISNACNNQPQSIAPFDMIITVEPTLKSPIPTPFTDTLHMCVFTKEGLTTRQGETSVIVTIPFIFYSWNRFGN